MVNIDLFLIIMLDITKIIIIKSTIGLQSALEQNLYWKEASSSWYLANSIVSFPTLPFFKDSFPSSFEMWNLQRKVGYKWWSKISSRPLKCSKLANTKWWFVSRNQSSSGLVLISFLKGMSLVWINDSGYREVPFIVCKQRTRKPPLVFLPFT